MQLVGWNFANRAIKKQSVEFDRYRGMADTGEPSARQIEGFTA
jgi:hypothetical protein